MGWEEDPPIPPARSSAKARQPTGGEHGRRSKKTVGREVGEEDAAGRRHRLSTGPFTPVFGTPRTAVGELRHLDATHIKVHQDANASGHQRLQAIGLTKGGRNTKATALVDGAGRAVQITLAPGQRADVKAAEAIRTPKGKRVVADKGYDSDRLRGRFAAEGAATSICPKSNRRSKVPFHRGYYRLRHRVENLFQRLKRFRAICTRYDKSDVHFSGALHLAAIIDWLRFGV